MVIGGVVGADDEEMELRGLRWFSQNGALLNKKIEAPSGCRGEQEMAATDYERVIELGQRLGVDEVLGRFDAEQRLTELRLSRLGLVEIPPEVPQFLSLEKLYLNANRIAVLPAEIGQLTHLQLLGLRENRLSALPSTFAQLASLRLLDLGHNQLTTLPVDILAKLPKLELLDISGNPITNLADLQQLTCTIKR